MLWLDKLTTNGINNLPFVLSKIFVRRPKGVAKKQGCDVIALEVLLSDKDRLSTGAVEPVL